MTVVLVEGPLVQDVEVKRNLVKGVTDAIVETCQVPRDVVIVLIKEVSFDNTGSGGQLVSDRRRRPESDSASPKEA